MDDLFEAGGKPETSPEEALPEKAKRKPRLSAAQVEALKAEPVAGNQDDSPPFEPGKVGPSAEAATQLVVAEAQADPVALFTDGARYSAFYERVRDAVSGHKPDLSTDTGRKAVASLAFRVTKSKTALDAAGKALTEEWRKQTAAVNAARAKMVSELDALAKEVRRPLTEWEEREAQRVVRVEAELDALRAAAQVGEEETADQVEGRGRELYERALDPDVFLDRLEEAQAAKDAAVLALLKARDRLRKAEADAAELERLRAENAEREERERVEREEREAREAEAAAEARRAQEAEEAAQRERDRAEAEERRVQEAAERAAQAERERLDAIALQEREDAERERQAVAQREEEERQAAQAERDRLHAAELEAQRKAAADAQAAAVAAEAREVERQRQAAAEAEEQRKREANQAHRKKIALEASLDLAALIDPLAEEPSPDNLALARRLVLAIVNREVRHTSISF